jgi:hypothetical protein
MWVTDQQRTEKDFSIQNHGDKGQFTGCGATAASGAKLKWQLVFMGKTSRCFPKFDTVTYVETSNAVDNKGNMTVCCKPVVCGTHPISEVGSVCATYNHWSNLETSKAWVQDIFIPYCKQTCFELSLVYGEAAAVLMLDVWWGWIGEFVTWLKVSSID